MNKNKTSSPGLIALLERNGLRPLKGSTESILIVKTSELYNSGYTWLCGSGYISIINTSWLEYGEFAFHRNEYGELIVQDFFL